MTDHIDAGIFTATAPSCEVANHVQSEIPLLRQRIQDLTLDPSLTLNDFDVIELSLESSEMLEWATDAHIVDIPSFLWTYQGKTFIVEHHDIDRVAVEVIRWGRAKCTTQLADHSSTCRQEPRLDSIQCPRCGIPDNVRTGISAG